jgi:hypothetical protein
MIHIDAAVYIVIQDRLATTIAKPLSRNGAASAMKTGIPLSFTKTYWVTGIANITLNA